MSSKKPLDKAMKGSFLGIQEVPKPKPVFMLAIVLIQLFLGIYILFNIFYPRIHLTATTSDKRPEVKGETSGAVIPDNRPITQFDKLLIIPKINLTEPIFQSGKSSLNKGIWHKFSDRSDPKKGGNFVLTGHRFTFGMTPDETLRKSPLYNVDKLVIGDTIRVKWNDKTFDYSIYSIKEVPNTAIEIENQTRNKILTMYTCTFLGEGGPRLVIKARPS